jgi:hypothetical protein
MLLHDDLLHDDHMHFIKFLISLTCYDYRSDQIFAQNSNMLVIYINVRIT